MHFDVQGMPPVEDALYNEAKVLRVPAAEPSFEMLSRFNSVNIKALLSDKGNKQVIGTLGFVSVIMLTFPVLAFFVAYAIAKLAFQAATNNAVTAAGVVAVIAVNVVSLGYVYYAYCVEEIEGDTENDAKTKKRK